MKGVAQIVGATTRDARPHPAWNICEIGGDYILGHATDEDGIEYVQLWPLSRTGPRE